MKLLGQDKLKPRMTYDELAEVLEMNYPALVANKNNVGRFAKKIGYRWAKQQEDLKPVHFYVRADLETSI